MKSLLPKQEWSFVFTTIPGGWVGGWLGGWVAGEVEIKTTSASVEVEVELSGG